MTTEEVKQIRVGYIKLLGVQQFQGNHEDIHFYTGLAVYINI